MRAWRASGWVETHRGSSRWESAVSVVHRGGERRFEVVQRVDPRLTPGAQTAPSEETLVGSQGRSPGADAPRGMRRDATWSAYVMPKDAPSWLAMRGATIMRLAPRRKTSSWWSELRGASAPGEQPAAPPRSKSTVQPEPQVSTWGRRVVQPRNASSHPDARHKPFIRTHRRPHDASLRTRTVRRIWPTSHRDDKKRSCQIRRTRAAQRSPPLPTPILRDACIRKPIAPRSASSRPIATTATTPNGPS
jgi:hypothetical protein